MKRLILTIMMIGSFFCADLAFAQKKEISVANDNVKAGKNLSQAQASMEKLLRDSANHSNKKIWHILYESVRKQYEEGNEKFYLKQSYDTVKLFHLARQLFVVAQGMDSVEMVPDTKGKVRIEYRKGHAEYLSQIRRNLYSGGLWFVRKLRYEDAYHLLDQYLNCANSPLFRGYDYQEKDSLLPTAAYWTVYCGYKMKNPKLTLHHSYEALKDKAHYSYMLQYLAETYKLEKDTMRYLNTLQEGFSYSPGFPFFFPRLVEHFMSENQLDSAMSVVERALEQDAGNPTYLYTKSTILLNQGKNHECLDICQTLLNKNDSLPELYYNAGVACFNMAIMLDKNTQDSKKRHQDIIGYYKRALPYLEKYKSLEPKEISKWSLPLYTIYLNLNMGKEFDEIDKLMRNQNNKMK